MSVIDWEKDESAAIITMCNGENRHNPEFISTFLNILHELEEDETVSSLIILSNDKKNWSLGIDLKWTSVAIHEQNFRAVKEFMFGLNTMFERMLIYPLPIIAAINGHVTGNGVVMACACDYRFMKSDRGFFSFPEIDTSTHLLPGMIEIMKKAIPPHCLEEIIFSGKRLVAEELEALHIIKKACKNEEELIMETLTLGKSFKRKQTAFGTLKQRLHKSIIEIMINDDPEFIESLH